MKHAFLITTLATLPAFGLACPALAQTSGAFSATLNGFQPTPAYSQLSASNVSSSVLLPFGTTVIVYNNGPNAAYVTLGNSTVTATTEGALIQPSNWMAFAAGANAYLAGITSSGTTTLTISGGMAGADVSIPTGSAGSPNANVVSVQGVSGATALPVTGTFWQPTQPVSLASLPALAASANTIGAVTQASGPWSFNLTQINGAAVNTGKGASSTGTARVALSSDSPGGALANPGFNYITDGTHTVSVKAGSTSAASTDQSLVVQINPQQTPAVSLSQINGSATATSATGVQEVGVVGHAGASLDATLSPGAAPTNMVVGGLQYNSSTPTLSNGQTVALQSDSSGNLNVNIAAAIPSGSNTIGTVNLGALNGAATAANQPALNADGGALAHVTNLPATQAVSAASLPLPSNAAQETGGNLATVASNTKRTNAGTSASNALPVQGVAGGVAIPVSGTFWQPTQPVIPQLQISNGLSKAAMIGVTNSAVPVFSGQHQLMKVDCDNNNTSLTYLQMFDATSGVTVGTTAPSDFKPLQPGLGGGWMAPLVGAQYSTGLMVAATTGPDNGLAPPTTINCSFFYN